MEQEQQKRYRAWAEIDLNHLEHNYRALRAMLPALGRLGYNIQENRKG